MSRELATVVYLEADDEVTSVVRRIREADAPRVIVVAPGRSRATSSAVALRLPARAGETEDREVAVVGDALTRSLAAEAGLMAHASVDEARLAETSAVAPPATVHAPIRVIRGADDTVAGPVTSGLADEATAAAPVIPPARPAVPARRPRRTALAVVFALAAVLLVAFVAGATVLPAATVTLEPVTEPVGPIPYVIEVDAPERLTGSAEATATVRATGTYERLEPANGTVVFRNWTPFEQVVEAGTLVAAGEQAFETAADVAVPGGELTADGRIAAGEAMVDVVASAPGPAANVAALAIDTVLSRNTDARLRGFRGNDERTVLNPEPTSGGLDETGPRIRRADVDAAVAALTDDLRAQAGEAIAAGDDGTIIVQSELPEPSVDGVDDLAGRRDEPEATISGTQIWEAFAVERAQVIDAAISRLLDDPDATPAGRVVLPDSVTVDVEEASVEGRVLRVDVTVRAAAVAEVDTAEVVQRIVGRSAGEARAALADLGQASVDLWPGWVTSVPEAEWRIDVRVVSP